MSDTEPGDEEIAENAREQRRRRRTKTKAPEPVETGAREDEQGEEESEQAEADEPEPVPIAPLLPEGNPLRWIRGSIAIGVGGFVAFCLMAVKDQLRYGVPLGALAILVATAGVLDLLGTFDDGPENVAGAATAKELAGPVALFAGGVLAIWLFISLAVQGSLTFLGGPVITAGITIPLAMLMAVLGVYRVGERLSIWEDSAGENKRPLHHRHGFWLVTAMIAIYLPSLGSKSLSDPWETHYGEVAREILARNDWISLWWAQDGWFWSKPVLDFWVQALAMGAFGVRYQPDAMLSAVREGRTPWPEWPVRLPVFLLTLIAVYLLYKAVARMFGRRAGLLGGVALLTMPQWFLLTHQTMTDMPFVAPMAAAMALLLLGAHTDPNDEVRRYEVSIGPVTLRFTAVHLVLGAVIACSLPQILYLLSRNVPLDIRGFHFRPDTFSTGSPGNCGLPGNEACRQVFPVLRGLHPALQALVWLQALGLVLYMSWGERRARRMYFLAAWFFAALSTMAKGPAGVLLPVVVAGAYVAATRRWRDLLDLEIPAGVLIVLAVALPWFVAMYARHGQPFTDRLIFHDMFKRAFTHVHDTNEGDDVSFRFYVWQLGYAMFPWTGLVPAALLTFLRGREERPRTDGAVFFGMWFVLAFVLFSWMQTKFHHYILPALPPAAMLVGVLLDNMLARSEGSHEREAPPKPIDVAMYGATLGAGALLAVLGVARVVPFVRGSKGDPWITGALLALAGVAMIGVAAVKLGPRMITRGEGPDSQPPASSSVFPERADRALLGAAAVAGAIVIIAVGRDLSTNTEGVFSQIRLIHLITYNYKRPWPPSLDFTPMLWSFTVVAAVVTAAIAWARYRRQAVGALLAVGVVFAVWGLDVFFMKTSPHWGQRETILAYYKATIERAGPLIAYQMNWKGENFYTGNRVPAFVGSGKKFQDYVSDEKRRGKKTIYFVTEHGRTSSLQNEIGATRSFEKLTTPELNNKFVLVRAVFD